MRATILDKPGSISLENRPDPTILVATDAIVKVVASCVCGSDLWGYRGISEVSSPRRMGHEFVGIVEAVGSGVTTLTPGQFVVAPFWASDGTCVHCLNGVTTSCTTGGLWGGDDGFGTPIDGGQADWVRVPLADGTLLATPDLPDAELVPDLLTLSDVMATGHHAAVAAHVVAGSTVVVVGDGAVGLCAVLAAARLGASRIIAMSRHGDRQALALAFGATDIVSARGADGVGEVRELLGGIGADCVLECVGTKESMDQAIRTTRPGGHVGYVGVPAGGPELPIDYLFEHNVNIGGGIAPARTYLPALMNAVLDGEIRPGAVFDLTLPLDQVADAYAAMDDRRAIKVMLKP